MGSISSSSSYPSLTILFKYLISNSLMLLISLMSSTSSARWYSAYSMIFCCSSTQGRQLSCTLVMKSTSGMSLTSPSSNARCFHPRFRSERTLFMQPSLNWVVPGMYSFLVTMSRLTWCRGKAKWASSRFSTGQPNSAKRTPEKRSKDRKPLQDLTSEIESYSLITLQQYSVFLSFSSKGVSFHSVVALMQLQKRLKAVKQGRGMWSSKTASCTINHSRSDEVCSSIWLAQNSSVLSAQSSIPLQCSRRAQSISPQFQKLWTSLICQILLNSPHLASATSFSLPINYWSPTPSPFSSSGRYTAAWNNAFLSAVKVSKWSWMYCKTGSVMNFVFESLSLAREKMILIARSSFNSRSQKFKRKRTELASYLNQCFLLRCTFLWNLIGFVERVKAKRKSTFCWKVS